MTRAYECMKIYCVKLFPFTKYDTKKREIYVFVDKQSSILLDEMIRIKSQA